MAGGQTLRIASFTASTLRQHDQRRAAFGNHAFNEGKLFGGRSPGIDRDKFGASGDQCPPIVLLQILSA
jgi:hypothetical protein